MHLEEIEILGKITGTRGELEANRRALTAFLALKDLEFQNPEKLVMLIGTTERPWEVIGSVRRRLEKRICKFLSIISVFI